MSCSMSRYEEIMRAEKEAEELEKNLYYRYMYNGEPVEDMIDSLLEEPPFAQQETKAQKRKQTPVFSGVLKYFPNALKAVARCSQSGNDQHHRDKPLHWDMNKSSDEYDAMIRHLLDHQENPVDDDNVLHLTKVAWRALAGLERYLTGKLDEGQK